MSKTFDIGISTAYGAAVRGGYAGTYEQFCADLARLADVLEEFLGFSVTIQTLAAGQQATASYENGVLSLGIPRGDTGNGIQGISLLSTVGLVKTYRITYTNGNHFDFPVADGKGIQSTTLNNDYTLTIIYTDGTQWTSTSIRGAVGQTPNLSIGTVQTLQPGESASATITGTPENPVLNLALPKGNPGGGDANDITYNPESTYNDGTAGKAISTLNRQLSDETTGLDSKAPVIVETASGAIATFTDGADSMPIKKLVAQIEPVQDLHGYENPWPGGGGVNKFGGQWPPDVMDAYAGWEMPATTSCRLAIYDKGNNADISGIYFGMSDNGVSTPVTWLVTNGVIQEQNYNQANRCYVITYTNPSLRKYVSVYPPTQESINKILNRFNVICFVDNDVTGVWSYSPYSNECPISGWTGAAINQLGKNLFDGTTKLGYYDESGYVASTSGWRCLNPIRIKENTSYKITKDGKPTGTNGNIFFYDVNMNYISYTGQTSVSFLTPAGSAYMGIYGDVAGVQNIIMISEVDTGTTVEPYTGNQISVNWEDEAGTVYGGTLTLNPDRTGTLVVDSVKAVTTWVAGDASGAVTELQRKAFYPQILTGHLFNTSEIAKCKCNIAHMVSRAEVVGFWPYAASQFYLTLPADTSGSTVVEFFFPIADPFEITLTESEISGILTTLYGTNNIWSSTGDTEVTYPADTKLYIDGKLAEIQATILENIGG